MKSSVLILFILLFGSQLAFSQGKSSKVELYPVPLRQDKLSVRMTSSTAQKAKTLELRNFIGKKLRTIQCEGKKVMEFDDMRQFPEGIYVVLVKGKNGKIESTAKFMISK